LPLTVGTVTGDDITDQLDKILARGIELRNMDTGEPLASIRDRVQRANAYLGAFPVSEALRRGADVVVSGRVADAALVLAPMIHEFGWGETEWDKLSAGIIAGHVAECGAQGSGGNCQVDWETVPDLANVGYPIIEAERDATFAVTKHAGTGGRITTASVKEQLLYEIGDPRAYITPDVVADFTTIQLHQDGADRVRFRGIKGLPATNYYKVSISYSAGFKAMGQMAYAWPDALKKARVADRILRQRLDKLGLKFDEIRTEFLGAGACHGIPAAEPSPEIEPHLPEVVLRVGVRSQDRKVVERFTREIASLALNGPPVASGLGLGRPQVDMAKRKLIELAHARSGDKGDKVNIGLIAKHPEDYPILVREVTADRVKEHFAAVCKGKVERFELPNLEAMNFLLHEALDGGGTMALKADPQGKTYSTALLRMEIDVD
jgi:hypothetical protein